MIVYGRRFGVFGERKYISFYESVLFWFLFVTLRYLTISRENEETVVMAFTPEQIAKIRQKEAALSDAHHRDPLTNYYEGYFFVTLNTREESPILSTVVGRPGVQTDSPDYPRCVYTELGKGVIESWNRMPTICKTVSLGPCEAMPDHFHGLLHLLPGNKRHLGSLISGFMAGCTHAYWDILGIDWRSSRDENGAYAQVEPDRDADHTYSFRGPALFTRGYNDVEPITPEQVQIKIEYIRTQAERRLIKRLGHDRFRIYRNQRSKNWHTAAALAAIVSDRFFSRNEAAVNEAWDKAKARLHTEQNPKNAQGGQNYASSAEKAQLPLLLDYLGNKQFMASDKKLPLICHRADAHLFEKQWEAVLDAARRGYVIVSAFISPKEREIREQLLTELLPFIEIMDNGFSDRYKPSGKAFYACAENRMVQISPWNYLYQKESSISREMCLLMNELARVIAKEDDTWWK